MSTIIADDTAVTTPPAGVPIPSQRTRPELAPTTAVLYPDLFELGKGVAAGDVWRRTCCPGSFTTSEPERGDTWSDTQFAAYAGGYAAGVPAAEAKLEAQGGYAGVLAAFGAEFAEGTVDYLIDLFDDTGTLAEMWRVYRIELVDRDDWRNTILKHPAALARLFAYVDRRTTGEGAAAARRLFELAGLA